MKIQQEEPKAAEVLINPLAAEEKTEEKEEEEEEKSEENEEAEAETEIKSEEVEEEEVKPLPVKAPETSEKVHVESAPAAKSSNPLFGDSDEEEPLFKEKSPAPTPVKSDPTPASTPAKVDPPVTEKSPAKKSNPLFGDDDDEPAAKSNPLFGSDDVITKTPTKVEPAPVVKPSPAKPSNPLFGDDDDNEDAPFPVSSAKKADDVIPEIKIENPVQVEAKLEEEKQQKEEESQATPEAGEWNFQRNFTRYTRTSCQKFHWKFIEKLQLRKTKRKRELSLHLFPRPQF